MVSSLVDSIRMEAAWERPPYVKIDQAHLAALIRLWRPHETVKSCSRIPQGARNTNYRIAFEGHRTEFVMRIYASDPEAWKKEPALDRLLRDTVPMPKVVYSGYEPSIFERPITVFEYVEGETLLDSLARGNLPSASLAHELGASLARIHAHRYDKLGSVDEKLRVIDDLPPFDTWVELFLNERAVQRLGADATARYLSFVRRHQAALDHVAEWLALVHGDYRPTNILVRDDRLMAVIDWEFCMADHPFSDLGQIIRHGWMSPQIEAAFVHGYNGVSASPLPADWAVLARLRDSINLLQLIGGTGHRPTMYGGLKRLIMSAVES